MCKLKRTTVTLADVLLVNYNAAFYSATTAKFEMLHDHKKLSRTNLSLPL